VKKLTPCQHVTQSNYQPTGVELEKMFQDYSKSIVETLPNVLQKILEKSGLVPLHE
jgi:hypothetical protein